MSKDRQEAAAYLRRICMDSKGDDLHRALSAFRGSDLSDIYGQSGRTKQQIIDGYREANRLQENAMNLLEEMLKKEAL